MRQILLAGKLKLFLSSHILNNLDFMTVKERILGTKFLHNLTQLKNSVYKPNKINSLYLFIFYHLFFLQIIKVTRENIFISPGFGTQPFYRVLLASETLKPALTE